MKTSEVKELIGHGRRPVLTVDAESSAVDALKKMDEGMVHHLVVTRRGKYLGMVSHFDLANASLGADWYGSARATRVGEAIRKDVPLIPEHTDVKSVLAMMMENGFTALPLESNGVVIDVVSESDLLKVLEHLLEVQHSRQSEEGLLEKGEAALASPLAQKLMRALSDAGV